jgi:hypothetical protein
MLSDFDRNSISKIMAGHGNWFTAELLRLIMKADPQHRARIALGFPEEVAVVEDWLHTSCEDDDHDHEHDDETETDLGGCCACGKVDPTVRNVIMMDKRGPKAGEGWGCVQCGLPMDGAVYVLCDACFAEKHEPKYICVGYPKENVRIPITEITEPFEHDMTKHNNGE